MVDEGLAYAPASDLLELIAAKQVSPVELAEMFLQRIDRLDPQLNSLSPRDAATSPCSRPAPPRTPSCAATSSVPCTVCPCRSRTPR